MTTDLRAPDDTGAETLAKTRVKTLMPWLIVAVWMGLVVGAYSLAGKLESVTRDDPVDFLPASAESTKVLEAEAALPGGGSGVLMVVYERADGLQPGDRQAVVRGQTELARQFGSDPDARPRVIESDDGTALMYALPLKREAVDEDAGTVTEARDLLGDRPADLNAYVTGPNAIESDMEEVFETIDSTLMLTTAVVVAILLILTYRSPLLWLVPLVSVGIAAVTAMGVVSGLAQLTGFTVTSMSSGLMIVLVFGAGTDYALLVVARYREELHRHDRPVDAMLAALRAAGPAIVASAATVMAGLLCLLAADLNSTSGLGPVGAAAIGSALAVMLTLVPAMLVALGRRIFWPFVPRSDVEARPTRWARLGDLVERRRFLGWAVPMLVLGGLALGTAGATDRLPQLDQFARSTPESVAGQQVISARYPEQSGQPLTILSRPEQSARVLTAAKGTSGVAEAEIGGTATTG